eukprot:2411962-Pleurochrysis_carterae.AAC.1
MPAPVSPNHIDLAHDGAVAGRCERLQRDLQGRRLRSLGMPRQGRAIRMWPHPVVGCAVLPRCVRGHF